MERPHPILTIRTRRHVWLGTVGITVVALLATCMPILLSVSYFAGSVKVALVICAQAAIFPIFIAPPLAWFGLSVARLLTLTVDRMDSFVGNDPLTGVLSRAYLLGKSRELAVRGGAFLMIDADHFKSINDTYGHDVGDDALKHIAELLGATLPADALLGRLGGEEFGAFLPGACMRDAAGMAQRVCEQMRSRARDVAGYRLNVTVSIGVAEHRAGAPLNETIKRADQALYRAKKGGRDRVHVEAERASWPEPASVALSD